MSLFRRKFASYKRVMKLFYKNKIMKATELNYFTALNNAINMKQNLDLYDLVKRYAESHHISFKRAFWRFADSYCK